MPKIEVTLSSAEVRAAVSEWAKQHHGMLVDPKNVILSTRARWVGQGISKEQIHEPEVTFVTGN
ncbi:MAG: hypothetical protein AAGI12_08040 [Pseudomonadota bacterium]